MSCRHWRDSLMELSRGGLFEVNERKRAVSHMSVCAGCSRFFDEQLSLTAAEGAFADEIAAVLPPFEIEQAVLAEYAARARMRRRRFVRPSIATAGIAAALVCASLFLPRHAGPKPDAGSKPVVVAPTILPVAPKPESSRTAIRRVRRRPKPTPSAAQANTEEPFVAIPYTIPLDPRERATVVRMEMPVAALTAVGLGVPAADSSASAQADVIVGEDGRMRAIRLVSISDSNSDRRRYQ
jgi:hypothetical protein